MMNYEHLHFIEAIEELAKLHGAEIPYESNNSTAISSLKKDHRQNLYHTMDKLAEQYQACLKAPSSGQPAQSIGCSVLMKKPSNILLWGMPCGLDYLSQNFCDSQKMVQPLIDAGMLIISSKNNQRYYDRFRNRILFPIRDSRGRTVAFGGRVLNDELPKYLNSPETEIYQKSRQLYGLMKLKAK